MSPEEAGCIQVALWTGGPGEAEHSGGRDGNRDAMGDKLAGCVLIAGVQVRLV